VGGRIRRPLAGQRGSAAEGGRPMYWDGIAGREKAVESSPPPEEEILGDKTVRLVNYQKRRFLALRGRTREYT
jgi:hypothetical protein